MRVYMFGGVLAVMAGIGFFGLALPPHQGGASSPGVVLIHHTLADEGIDASDVRFGDCTTQRNLFDAGRLEAEAMGARFNAHGFVVQRVLVSPFCRTAETARLMKLRPIELSAAFQNIRGDGSDAISRARIDAARKILDSWSGPGVLVVVTHGSTIKALTGMEPQARKFIVYHNHSRDRVAGSQETAAKFELMAF